MKDFTSPVVNLRKRTVEFRIRTRAARSIAVAGSFNRWAPDEIMLRRRQDDIWSVEIPMPPGGRYQYRFIIDGRMSMEDIENPYREPDGVAGWYSVLFVENLQTMAPD